MTTNVSDDNKKGVNRSLLIGVLLIILGIVAIAVPAVSTLFALDLACFDPAVCWCC